MRSGSKAKKAKVFPVANGEGGASWLARGIALAGVFSTFDGGNEMVRIACGARDAKTVEHGKDEIQGGFERYAMALRYIDWLHAGPSAQNCADGFTVIMQWCP